MLLKSAVLAIAAAQLAAAVTPLDIKGNAFVNPQTGHKFQIVGMAYQPGGESNYKPQQGIDPLSDGHICRRDAALMQKLGINVIRSYNLSPNISHDECASIFDKAGIYMMVDVNAPGFGNSLNRKEPWTTYYDGYLSRVFGIVEQFKGYPNTLAFYSANEVIDKPGTASVVPPYLRAMQRDLKAYIAKHSDRHIPVGYSAADVRNVLDDTYNYLVCDNKDGAEAEFFALNSYSWCGPDATFESTYAELVHKFKDSPVPVFFSEYGCNTPQPRYFNEVQSIYGSNMSDVWSGGIVYEWTQEANDYGVVDVSDKGDVTFRQDYSALQDQFLKLDINALQNGKGGPGGKTPACDSKLITEDDFNGNFTLPKLPPGGQELIDNGVSYTPVGKLIDISDYSFGYTITDDKGKKITGLRVQPVADDSYNLPGAAADAGDVDGDSAAGVIRPATAAAALVSAAFALVALVALA